VDPACALGGREIHPHQFGLDAIDALDWLKLTIVIVSTTHFMYILYVCML
jgi:hypothetical protein